MVTKDVPQYGLVAGNPARLKGWMCWCGIKLPMPVAHPMEEISCAACGRRYQGTATMISEIPSVLSRR